MKRTMNYKTGDIFHCTGHGIISRLIRFATKSKISHTAMFIEVWGQPYIVEAQAKGVYIISFDEWCKKWKYKYIVHRPVEDINEKVVAIKAMSKLGHTGYDFASLLLRKPIDILTGRWRYKKDEDERMFCSEYIAWIYNIDIFYRFSPNDLYLWCEGKNYIVLNEDIE